MIVLVNYSDLDALTISIDFLNAIHSKLIVFTRAAISRLLGLCLTALVSLRQSLLFLFLLPPPVCLTYLIPHSYLRALNSRSVG